MPISHLMALQTSNRIPKTTATVTPFQSSSAYTEPPYGLQLRHPIPDTELMAYKWSK